MTRLEPAEAEAFLNELDKCNEMFISRIEQRQNTINSLSCEYDNLQSENDSLEQSINDIHSEISFSINNLINDNNKLSGTSCASDNTVILNQSKDLSADLNSDTLMAEESFECHSISSSSPASQSPVQFPAVPLEYLHPSPSTPTVLPLPPAHPQCRNRIQQFNTHGNVHFRPVSSTYKALEDLAVLNMFKEAENKCEANKSDDSSTNTPKSIPSRPPPNRKKSKRNSPQDDESINYRHISENIINDLRTKPTCTHTTSKQNMFIHHGDDISEERNPNMLRFVLNNPNGLYGDRGDKFDDLITQFVNYNIDFLALPENKLNPKSPFAKDITDQFHARIPGGRIAHTNTKLVAPSSDTLQYGGISTLLSERLNKRHSKTEYDKYGRWICNSFFLKSTTLKVYTVYRVSYDGEDHEESATTAQQHQLEEDDIHVTPRKHVVDALRIELEKDLDSGKEVMVMADANESRIHPSTHMLKMMESLGFTNIMNEKLGKSLPPTQNRGKEAIDHIWVSEVLRPFITARSILPLYELIDSDHRALVLELDMRRLFSEREEPLTHFDKRRLHSTDIKVSEEYRDKLSTQLEEQHVHSRIKKYKLNKSTMSYADRCSWLDSSDNQLAEIRIGSENRQHYKSREPWTPECAVHRRARYRLRKRINKIHWMKGKKIQVDEDELSHLKEKLEVVKDIIEERDQNHKEIKLEAQQLRAKDWVERGKFKTEETALKVILNTEKICEDARYMKSVFNNDNRAGLNFLLIPTQEHYTDGEDYKDPDTIWNRIEVDQGKDIKDWEAITRQDEMEHLLLEWSQKHFTQANTTPLATPEWIESLEAAQSFDDIRQESESLTETNRALLEELFPSKPNPDVKFTLTLDDFKTFIDGKDERTTTSPANIHYGHFKAARDHVITEYTFFLIQESLELTYIPSRWRRTITTLIPKDTDPQIHRLRPLHIVEPEMQFLSNKFWSQDFMRHCEEHGLITDSQYGGRRGRQAQSAVIKQVLLWDIVKLQNKLLASHMADARANFDRNMRHIVGRALISLGFDESIVRHYQAFLKSQVFHIKTAFGVSNKSYKSDQQNPLFGDGQGIGWSSVNQIIISSVIDFAFNKLAEKFRVSSNDDLFQILTGTNFFIDDRISNTINHDDDIDKLLEEFQRNETLQTELLNTTGGAIAPKKCHWWLLQREPNKSDKSPGFNFRIRPTKDGILLLKNTGDLAPHRIKRLKPSDAQKYLGCLICPSYSPKAQLSKLHEIVDKWCSKVRHARLTIPQIRKAYNERLVPKLSYPLVVCDMSWNNAEVLMRKIRVTIAEKTKYHRSSALDITHGPTSLFGEDLIHIYDLAGREKFAFFQMHVRNSLHSKDTVHDALMTSFMDHQLALGTTTNFLNLDFNHWSRGLHTRTWLISLWEYLWHHRCQVDLVKFPSYTMPRENDFMLMDCILDSNESLDDIRIFNKVRMHFELLTASDVVLDNGETIHKEILKRREFSSRTSSFRWPNKENIINSWYTTFRRMITDHIKPALSTTPLGSWISKSHQSHKASLISPHKILYESHIYNHYKGARFHKSETQLDMPNNHIQVAILPTNELSLELLEISSFDENTLPPKPEIDPMKWKQDLWGIHEITEEKILELAEHLQQPFIAVSDGGLPNFRDYSVFSWALATPDGKVFFKTGLPIGGLSRDRSSYGSEAYGFFSMLSFLNMMDCRFPHLSRNRKYFCDNLEVTKTTPSLFVSPKRSTATKRHFDIFTQLRHELASHAFPITINHVRGHQDREKQWHVLKPEEKVNCIVDGHGHYIEDLIDENPSYIPTTTTAFLPAQGISLRTPLHRLVNGSFNEIYIDSKTANLMHFLNQKNDIHPHDSHLIDWDSIRSYSKSISHTRRRKFQKVLYRKWLTMKKLNTMSKTPDAICPLCTAEIESQHHVLKCSNTCAVSNRNAACNNLQSKLLSYKTPYTLTELLVHFARFGNCDDDRVDSYLRLYPTLQHKIHDAIDAQTLIGFHNIQAGLLASAWAPLIQEHYRLHNIKNRNASAWMIHVIGDMLECTHAAWVHRCEITNAPEEIELKVYRTKMFELYTELKLDPSPLGSFTSLIRRSHEFFKRHSRDQLEAWELKVNDAKRKTTAGLKKRKGLHRHFNTVRIRKPKSRRKTKTRLSNRRKRQEKQKRLEKIIRQSNIHRYCGPIQHQPSPPLAFAKIPPCPAPNIP